MFYLLWYLISEIVISVVYSVLKRDFRYTMVQVDIIFVLRYTPLIDIHINSYIIGTRVSLSPQLSFYQQQILTMLMLYDVVLVSMFIPAIVVG